MDPTQSQWSKCNKSIDHKSILPCFGGIVRLEVSKLGASRKISDTTQDSPKLTHRSLRFHLPHVGILCWWYTGRESNICVEGRVASVSSKDVLLFGGTTVIIYIRIVANRRDARCEIWDASNWVASVGLKVLRRSRSERWHVYNGLSSLSDQIEEAPRVHMHLARGEERKDH